MCGILYVKLKKNLNANFETICKIALEKMHYRGRDNIAHLCFDHHFFGHTRLSIIDTSSLSNQPIYNNRHVMLFNGEIYNYKDINPTAVSDTLALFSLLEESKDIPIPLVGMYALLIYDKIQDELSIYRDFYGEKPLYYYDDDNIFIASSTLTSITHILKEFHIELFISHQALYEYFLFGFIREPVTIYQDIKALESGHQLVLIQNKLSIHNHARRMVSDSNIDAPDYAVKCFSATDVQPLLLLSGGVDSTFILSLIQQQNEPFSILTYQSPNQRQDESKYALSHLTKICRDKLPEQYIVTNTLDKQELYDEFPKLLEQPSSNGINLLNILVGCRRTGNQQKLILTGLGGDELYGGYHSFKHYYKFKLMTKLKFVKKILPIKYLRFFLLPHYKEVNLCVEAYYFQYRLCPKMAVILGKNIIYSLFLSFSENIQKYYLKKSPSVKYRIKVYEAMDYMKNQLLRDNDNISMWLGFEARSPLLNLREYTLNPDGKKSIKKQLFYKNNIIFPTKKGFTLYEDPSKDIECMYRKLIQYNLKYNILSEKTLKLIKKEGVEYYAVLKKVFILLAWLDSHNVSAQALRKFCI